MRAFLAILFLLTGFSVNSNAVEVPTVEHDDPIIVDPDLSLSQLLENTLQKYPDVDLIPALQQENQALQQRGQSWLAQAASISLRYQDDLVADNTGSHEFEGALELPLWNWGQRQAGQNVAEQARQANELKQQIIKFRIAGLLRRALWNIRLKTQQLEMSTKTYRVAEHLLEKIQLRVKVGDLARIDLLLAESELLDKKSNLISAQAEIMHARKELVSLTQDNRIPANIDERQSSILIISSEHPMLQASNALINRKRAELEWVKAAGSGQSTVSIGGKSERDSRDGQDIESITFGLSVPFGGSAHLAPEIAAVQLQLTEAIAEREHLFRNLEKQLHEAEHDLEVARAELVIADQRKKIAEEHIRVTEISFNAGEINLMDSLKIQTRSFAAIQKANENAINLQRDIAFYNQAVGVLP